MILTPGIVLMAGRMIRRCKDRPQAGWGFLRALSESIFPHPVERDFVWAARAQTEHIVRGGW
jgi:hypothetical protein